jgi:hypothetical protein
MAPRKDIPTLDSQYDYHWEYDPKQGKYDWVSVPKASQPSQAPPAPDVPTAK